MFIGHFAVGFAAKRVTPRIPLAVLFAAAQLADMLWPIFVALGLEAVLIEPDSNPFLTLHFTSYPYSHSLLLLAVWGVIFGWLCHLMWGHRRVLPVIAALVVSHWVLDFITHRPDLPLYAGGPKLGLGLWNSIPATAIIEGLMFAGGVWVYAHTTRARDNIGRWAFSTFAAFLVVGYIANLMGPPPPSVLALSLSVIVGSAILTAWSWWADRHREPMA